MKHLRDLRNNIAELAGLGDVPDHRVSPLTPSQWIIARTILVNDGYLAR